MSIDLYFAGNCAKDIEAFLLKNKANRLFTQKFERNSTGKAWFEYMDENPGFTGKVFVDSSAFGAWTRNIDIDLDEYIDYLNANDGRFSVIASLDVIPGSKGHFATRQQVQEASEQSWENYLYMYDRVLDKEKVIPVFHVGEPWEYLDKILNHVHKDGSQVQYIGLGGLVGVHSNDRIKWIEQVFDVVKQSNNPNIKIHAFGVTSLKILEQFPFTSADSTTAVLTGAMGGVLTPYGKISFAQKDGGVNAFYAQPQHVQEVVLNLVKEAGFEFTVEEIVDNYIARELLNCQYLLDWAASYKYNPPKHKQSRLF